MLEDTAITLHPYASAVLDVAVPALVTILGTVITVGAARANSWLRSKVQNETFQGASTRLDKLVEDAVAEAERTIVRDYKAATEDGVLSKSDGEKVRDDVVDVVKRHLGDKGQKKLLGDLGHKDFGIVEGMIRTRIEAGIHRTKDAPAKPLSNSKPGTPGPVPRSAVSPSPSGVKPAPKP